MSVDAAEMSGVVGAIRRVGTAEQERILALCRDCLHISLLRSSERTRILLARLLVALLPRSLGTILECLGRTRSPWWYEMHFTLFCYLDWACELPEYESLREPLVEAVSSYLRAGRPEADRAQANWMAGNLLGDHWNPTDSYRALGTLAVEAETPSGRAGALHGIEMILARPGLPDKARGYLMQTVAEVAQTDGHAPLRHEARRIIDEHPFPSPQ